jgi:hypothetical protein
VGTSGGLGSVAPSSAVADGNGVITFNFGTPVCTGQTSYFFGLTSFFPSVSASGRATSSAQATYTLNMQGPYIPVDLTGWLNSHTTIANAIKWQQSPADMANAYTPPTDANKVTWSSWSASQKNDLNQAYLDTCKWFVLGATQVAMNPNGLTDQPTNINPNVNDNSTTTGQDVTQSYLWSLYIAHVSFSLTVEITTKVPWSIQTYDATSLRLLFDSTSFAWNLFNSRWDMGEYSLHLPTNRVDNRPHTQFAPPRWIYPWLKTNNIIVSDKLTTIGNVLQWMRVNMDHFIGADNYGNVNSIWQYRGYPPISKIIAGTVDSNNPGYGTRHWTAGCHGSVGFLNAMLRIINVPVQPVWVCGHELAYFITEHKYMDHGDDPYNQNVKNSASPILNVLIDEATYQARFGNDQTVNILDENSPACGYVGYTAYNWGSLVQTGETGARVQAPVTSLLEKLIRKNNRRRGHP